MPDRHIIRLRGPWWGSVCATQDGQTTAQPPFKTTAPLNWPDQIPKDFVGTVSMTRKFNCSAGMVDATEVWLTISSLAVPAQLLLNESKLGDYDARSNIEIAVSCFLKPFNELHVVLSLNEVHSKFLLGDVAIEIAH